MFSRYPDTDNAGLNPPSLSDTTTRLNASFVDLKIFVAQGRIYWQVWLAIERLITSWILFSTHWVVGKDLLFDKCHLACFLYSR
ncbi:unnamed protein product, partial [Vitis vinifera]|uniref:Uncharacterized protein n=1 Tax=Vitis vinifera TaxID=29760 RepID=D7TYJ7_VITVI